MRLSGGMETLIFFFSAAVQGNSFRRGFSKEPKGLSINYATHGGGVSLSFCVCFSVRKG